MNDDHLDEMKALLESGDIPTLEYSRRRFYSAVGVKCTLSDEDILRCYGWQDGVYGEEDVIRRMKALQAGDVESASRV